MRQRTIRNTILTVLVCLFAMAVCTDAKTIYVDADAVGANDGSNWADAYKFLQDALADALASEKPVEIRVAQGIYRPDEDSLHPDGTGDREATFQLISGVTLEGGYAGFGDPDPNAHDIDLYETILSGDLNCDDGPNFTNNCDNSRSVVNGTQTDETAILFGLIIAGGNTEYVCGHGGGYGGGMVIFPGGSPRLINCIFTNNLGHDGGGLGNYMGSPTLINCTFTGNRAKYEGGGMHTSGEFRSNLILINCTFSNNLAGVGGAMFNEATELTLFNCTFIGNYSQCCAAIINVPAEGTMTNCILWDGGNEVGNSDNSKIEIIYSNVQGGWLGVGNIDADPCFADVNNGDYHLKSQAGRWDATGGRWVIDDVTSPCIDAGDPMSPIMHEPFPNGGVVNMGAYGGTPEASKSYFGEPPCETVVAGDINGDCAVDFKDFVLMALHWLGGG